MSSVAQQPTTLQTGSGLGDAEIRQWCHQVREGDFADFRRYLTRTRMDADWQDRVYVLECVAPQVSIDALDAACTAEPDAADLLIIRCAYYGGLAKALRGATTSDKVSSARFQNAGDCVKAALNDMARSARLDDKDPTALTLVLRPLTIFTQTELQAKILVSATAIAPDLVPAYFALISSKSKRWGGSHEACLAFARQAMSKVGRGSDMTGCLFRAHTLVRTHYSQFEKDAKAADIYGKRPEVVRELNTALDNWLMPPYSARRSSIPYLQEASEWYRATRDVGRLSAVIALTGEEFRLPPLKPATRALSGGVLSKLFGGR